MTKYKVEKRRDFARKDDIRFVAYKEVGFFFKNWEYLAGTDSLEDAKEAIEFDKSKVVYITN